MIDKEKIFNGILADLAVIENMFVRNLSLFNSPEAVLFKLDIMNTIGYLRTATECIVRTKGGHGFP